MFEIGEIGIKCPRDLREAMQQVGPDDVVWIAEAMTQRWGAGSSLHMALGALLKEKYLDFPDEATTTCTVERGRE